MVIAGARPNFMKIAPLMREFGKHKKIKTLLVHTGQHYDFQMSEVFFQELKIPTPDIHLNVKAGSHAIQTAEIMAAFEPVVLKHQPDLLIVVGDVTSTIACSLVAAKLKVKIAHVEAGLRSFDRTMPEEINRILTDAISDYLFVSEKSGLQNLKAEGVAAKRVYFVGNIMIDTLLSNLKSVEKSTVLQTHSLLGQEFCVLTLHRPSNVDSKAALFEILNILKDISKKVKIVWPIHPRTKSKIKACGLAEQFDQCTEMQMIEPLGYLDFIKLIKASRFVLTDSGGIQEETTVLKVPCLTMRENTERPSTIEEGTNILVGRNRSQILKQMNRILEQKSQKGKIPRYWDGRTAERIVRILLK